MDLMQEASPAAGSRVVVVVLNFNGWRDTVACVRSVLNDQASSSRCIVVVCDNDSSDGSMEALKGAFSSWPEGRALLVLDRAGAEAGHGATGDAWADTPLVLVQNGANLGFAGGCNVGLRWALHSGATHFWLLNNDTEISPGARDALLARMASGPRIGLCGSRLVYHHDRRLVQARGGAVFDPRTATSRHIGVHEPVDQPEDAAAVEQQMSYVVGASMMATRAFVHQVGLMQEDYFLYFEELDWAVRGRAAGFLLAYAPASVVFHKEGATIGSSHGRDGGSLLSMRFLSRNRLLFTRRHHPRCLGSVRRQMLYETAVFLKRRQWAKAVVVLQALSGRPVALPSGPAGAPGANER